jgi:KipI family sensor histidine kinase inhibitor
VIGIAKFPRFDSMGEAALLITFAQAMSDAANNRALRLAQSLRELRLGGITDVVPAYASTLVIFDPDQINFEDLEAEVHAKLPENAASTPPGRSVEIPVEYGGEYGPDLPNVARLHGITEEAAIRLHTSRRYRVYFIGFMPGFPYMGRLPQKLATPRVPTPRIRVAAGSVGIAGAQTGIYPLASPGGWQIIGRTSQRLWDVNRDDPSYLLPGDTVRFRQGAGAQELSDHTAAHHTPSNPVFEVLAPSGMATVQDSGRRGYGHLGLSCGGSFDNAAAMYANSLVGNHATDALFELTWSGPTLRVIHNVTIALSGTDMGCRVDGTSVPPGISWFIRSGSIVSFALPSDHRSGARAYMAVAGGVEVPRLLGSRATYLPGGFGGLGGRPLRAGDILGVGSYVRQAQELAGRIWPGSSLERQTRTPSLRFVRFDGPFHASERAVDGLCTAVWAVSEASDRMGVRLEGGEVALERKMEREVVSFGVVRGAIQVPPGGKPAILGPDHQTTGGYPLAGVVIDADFPILAQLRPGHEVRFQEVTRAEALQERHKVKRELLTSIQMLNKRV